MISAIFTVGRKISSHHNSFHNLVYYDEPIKELDEVLSETCLSNKTLQSRLN